jgi:hypothetical protein
MMMIMMIIIMSQDVHECIIIGDFSELKDTLFILMFNGRHYVCPEDSY